MTVSAAYAPLAYVGNGSTTDFPVTWPFIEAAHLVVKVDGVTQTLTTHYTVTQTASGGTVTMLAAPATGDSVVITRLTPKTQPGQLRAGGAYSPVTVERMLDRNVMQVQEIDLAAGADATAAIEAAAAAAASADAAEAAVSGKVAIVDLADDEDVDKGAALVGVSTSLDGFQPTTLAKHLQRAGRLSILSFIPEAEHAAIAARTSTYDCLTDIQKAIAAAKVIGAAEIDFPPGTYLHSLPLSVDSTGIYLVGSSSMNGDPRSTVLRYTGTALDAPDGCVRVLSPTGATLYKQRNLGLKRMIVDAGGLAPFAILVRSINVGRFESVSARGATDAEWLLDAAGTYAEAGDLQECEFVLCGFDAAEAASENADGFRFTGSSGNVSYNKFTLCGGFHKNGDAIRIINGDNNTFEHPRTFHATGGTGYSVHVDGNGTYANDYNRFLNHHFSAPVRLKGTESGFTSAPMGLYFQSDSSNNSRNPEDGISTIDASVAVVTELYGTARFGNVFGPVIIGEDIGAINNMASYTGPLNPLCVFAGSGSWGMFGSASSLYQLKPVGDAMQFYRADSPGNGAFAFDGEVQAAAGIAEFGATPPASKPQVTGSRSAAQEFIITQLLGILAAKGTLDDNTTA